MHDMSDAVIGFWESCRNRPGTPAAAANIPAVGPSLVTLMTATDRTQLLTAFQNLAPTVKAKVLSEMEKLAQAHSPSARPLIAIGSGNEESVLRCPEEVVLGRKHSVVPSRRYGGSCVNYSLRLLACGVPVLPIASIGDDRSGNRIRRTFLRVAERCCPVKTVLDFIGSEAFFAPGVETPQTTVLVHGPHRTIFSQAPTGASTFPTTLEQRLDVAERMIDGPPSAVLLGHIYGDRPDDHEDDLAAPGACTRVLVERYAGRSAVIVNFGQSQIERGAESWQDVLRKVDVLQLNLAEMRRLFAGGGGRRSLKHIITWLAERSVTAVVTLDRLGALGTYKDGRQGTVFAWSLINSDDVADPTGSGDAFAAGVATVLRARPDPSFLEFREAMGVGRLWAAYACTKIAGEEAHPTPALLAQFNHDLEQQRKYRPVEELHGFRAEEVIDLFDMAYH